MDRLLIPRWKRYFCFLSAFIIGLRQSNSVLHVKGVTQPYIMCSHPTSCAPWWSCGWAVRSGHSDRWGNSSFFSHFLLGGAFSWISLTCSISQVHEPYSWSKGRDGNSWTGAEQCYTFWQKLNLDWHRVVMKPHLTHMWSGNPVMRDSPSHYQFPESPEQW